MTIHPLLQREVYGEMEDFGESYKMIMLYSGWSNEAQHFFYKNIYVFLFFQKGLKLMLCVRDGWTDIGTDFKYASAYIYR